MVTPDVNILVQAFRPEMPEHVRCRNWLKRQIREGSLALSPLALSGMVRVVTNPQIFPACDTVGEALAFCDVLLASSNVLQLQPGARHWEIFTRLCRETPATGNLVPDAWFAALAIEHHCTWVTLDKDFERFAGLRLGKP